MTRTALQTSVGRRSRLMTNNKRLDEAVTLDRYQREKRLMEDAENDFVAQNQGYFVY